MEAVATVVLRLHAAPPGARPGITTLSNYAYYTYRVFSLAMATALSLLYLGVAVVFI
jgi:hypothetical protein